MKTPGLETVALNRISSSKAYIMIFTSSLFKSLGSAFKKKKEMNTYL